MFLRPPKPTKKPNSKLPKLPKLPLEPTETPPTKERFHIHREEDCRLRKPVSSLIYGLFTKSNTSTAYCKAGRQKAASPDGLCAMLSAEDQVRARITCLQPLCENRTWAGVCLSGHIANPCARTKSRSRAFSYPRGYEQNTKHRFANGSITSFVTDRASH